MKRKSFFIFAAFSLLFPFVLAVNIILPGGMAFWYDPARDMLAAWNNLSKVTLIGSTSGIPGIFYGPYWIWWLSFAEIFSKDPRVVLFITTTLPYIIIFPFFLYLFSKVFDKFTSFILWLLFSLSFQGYTTALWNPNLAPLLFLISIYFLTTYSLQKNDFKKNILLFLAGIVSGIAFNIHISFSVGFMTGAIIYLILESFLFVEKKPFIKITKHIFTELGSFFVGFAVVFLPFVLFEMRHGFSQTKTLFNAISHGGDVVALHGLSKVDIIKTFFNVPAKLLAIPFWLSLVIFLALVVAVIVVVLKKKLEFSILQKRLMLLLVTITAGVLSIYLTAKNPIWEYHFIGMEIIFLLALGLVMTKIPLVRNIIFIWVIVMSLMQAYGLIHPTFNPLKVDSLYAKEYTVSIIIRDIKNNPYTVFAYNSSIYNYDYAYLFRWLANKDFSYDPGNIHTEGIVYLIIPPVKKALQNDFIHFRTPDDLYTTTNVWNIPNRTQIIKRTPVLSKKNI